MNPLKIIEKYYDVWPEACQILISHSRDVAGKAVAIAKAHPEMNLDLTFIDEASMLHDIGIRYCHAPDIGCYGTYDYICHGYLGAELLQKEGFLRHALVCERHTGTGISVQMIIEEKLPLPHRDFLPVTMEEQLICFADKFFSKTKPGTEKSIAQIQESLYRHGEGTVLRFNQWCKLFL